MKSLAPVLSLGQMPLLITWFFTVRDMAMSPDDYPAMMSGKILIFGGFDLFFLLIKRWIFLVPKFM